MLSTLSLLHNLNHVKGKTQFKYQNILNEGRHYLLVQDLLKLTHPLLFIPSITIMKQQNQGTRNRMPET